MLRLNKPFFSTAESDAAKAVLDSGWLSEGSKTAEFEAAIARYVDAKFCVAVCNCTVALTLALKAHGVKHGDRVDVPDFTHPATAQAIINAGATPVLLDVSLESYNLKANGSHGNIAMPVSWAGNPLSWYPPSFIVEDAACSLGAEVDRHKVGSTFTSCFSLHPRKIITTGEGGLVTTNDKAVAEKIRSLKCFGKGGGNYRFNEVAAAIGIEQLKKIAEIIKVRREMAQIYTTLLSDVKGVKTPVQGKGGTYQTYAVYLEGADRDTVMHRLLAKGIETQIGTYALHLMPQFNHLKRVGKLENSALLYRNLLALPMAYDLTFDDQRHVVDELSKACNT